MKPYPQPDSTIKREGSSSVAAADPAQAVEEEEEEEEDGSIIPSESYDGLICGECVKGHHVLRDKAGIEGWMMIVPNDSGEFEVIGRAKGAGPSPGEEDQPKREDLEAQGQAMGEMSKKRSLDTSIEESDTKRRRLEGEQSGSEPGRGAGDVFLANGQREKLKLELDVSGIDR